MSRSAKVRASACRSIFLAPRCSPCGLRGNDMTQHIRSVALHLLSSLLLLGLVLTFSFPAQAESRNPFSKSCSSYSSPKEFVGEATRYCLIYGKSCERRAEAFFSGCGYDGSYRKISDKVYSKLLMMFVLTATHQTGRHDRDAES